MDRMTRIDNNRQNWIVFVGDWRISQVYWHFVLRMSPDFIPMEDVSLACANSGVYSYSESQLKLKIVTISKFIFLTKIRRPVFQELYCHNTVDESVRDRIARLANNGNHHPSLVIIGAALVRSLLLLNDLAYFSGLISYSCHFHQFLN